MNIGTLMRAVDAYDGDPAMVELAEMFGVLVLSDNVNGAIHRGLLVACGLLPKGHEPVTRYYWGRVREELP